MQTRHSDSADQVQQEVDHGADRGVQGVLPGPTTNLSKHYMSTDKNPVLGLRKICGEGQNICFGFVKILRL